MTNVLITGITGFIGSHLARRLVDEDYSVYGIVKHTPQRDMRPIEDIKSKIALVTADFRDYHSIRDAISNVMPDYVCHLGALTPVRLSFERPFEFLEHNYLGTLNIIHSMLTLPDFQQRQLIMASTAEVYGWQPVEKPLTEDLALHPSSPYAVAKTATDMYARMAMKVYDLNCTVMRCTNTYGRKFETMYLVEYLVTQMLKGEDIYIGSPDSARDYMYVDDHVNAYYQCIKNKKSKGQVFNAGTGVATKNGELAQTIAKVMDYDTGKLHLGQYPPGYPRRSSSYDQPYICLNAERIGKIISWKPELNLEQGLEKTVEYWRDRVKK